MMGTGVPFLYLSIGDPRYWARSWSRRWRTRWLIGRAAEVVAISPSARDVLVSHYGLAADRMEVIPNGRLAREFAPANDRERTAARRELGLPEGVDVVATIGSLTPEKRVDVAIAAMAGTPGAVLAVAGDGPERSELTNLADRVAPGRVHFLGATEGAGTVLTAADVLLLSSDSEGIPGVLIEAGMAGIPVVATDVGWVSDVVRHGDTGLLLPPGEPHLIAEALRAALDRRVEFGRAGRARCLAEFEMGPVADKWQRVIERTAGERRHRRVR